MTTGDNKVALTRVYEQPGIAISHASHLLSVRIHLINNYESFK